LSKGLGVGTKGSVGVLSFTNLLGKICGISQKFRPVKEPVLLLLQEKRLSKTGLL
jgi:hypothetical protein